MVRFKSGQSVASINIPIKDDNIYEEPNITIRIIIVPNKDIIVLSSDSVVTIVDDDHSELYHVFVNSCVAVFLFFC